MGNSSKETLTKLQIPQHVVSILCTRISRTNFRFPWREIPNLVGPVPSANYRHENQFGKSRKGIENVEDLTSPTRDDKLKAINHRQKSLQNTIKWNKQDRIEQNRAVERGRELGTIGGVEKKCHCQLNAGDFVWPLCATMWVINVICG